jgi:hypothetical protein
MKQISLIALSSALSLALAGQAWAQEASTKAVKLQFSGTAKVAAAPGGTFLPVPTGTSVAPGAQVLNTGKTQVQLVFDDGCTVNIGSGLLATVPEESPCKTGVAMVTESSPGIATAGETTALGGNAVGPITMGEAFIFGAAAIATTGVIVDRTSGHPASP